MNAKVLVCCGLVSVSAIACSKQEASTAAAPAAAVTPAAAPAPAPTSAPTSAPAPKAAPTPIATSEGMFSGLRADVTELKRSSGGTLTLKFTIVNDAGRALHVHDVGIGHGGLINAPYFIDGVHLIDPVGKKKYFVAKDSAGACVCSTFGAVDGGTRANHWAKFPAPPDDVERLSVVIPSFAPLDDVPVSR
jgi:hypothetical protein